MCLLQMLLSFKCHHITSTTKIDLTDPFHNFSFQIISIVIFASVSSQGYAISPTKQRYCLYNENPNACNYGVGGALNNPLLVYRFLNFPALKF